MDFTNVPIIIPDYSLPLKLASMFLELYYKLPHLADISIVVWTTTHNVKNWMK